MPFLVIRPPDQILNKNVDVPSEQDVAITGGKIGRLRIQPSQSPRSTPLGTFRFRFKLLVIFIPPEYISVIPVKLNMDYLDIVVYYKVRWLTIITNYDRYDGI